MNPQEIRVGVDGSPASRTALRWAAIEAVGHNAELVVVHAYDWRVVGARAQIGGSYADEQRARAEALVESAVGDARAFAPDVKVSGETVLGAPGKSLVHRSRNDGLTVVGSRGHGGFASLLLGSVSQQVATHALGSVVVVRGRSDIAVGPIVVGVDGSPAGDYALGVAFDEAVARGAGLVAVRVYLPAHPTRGTNVPPYVEDPVLRRDNEQRYLVEDVAPWRDKYPDIPVESVVLKGRAAEVLIGLSSSAQLVVVGTRGHGGFAGLLLGSVGLQLVHHADSPVLIARTTATTR